MDQCEGGRNHECLRRGYNGIDCSELECYDTSHLKVEYSGRNAERDICNADPAHFSLWTWDSVQ